MSLFSRRVTLHLRAEKVDEDALGEPIYGDPRDVEWSAWWELSSADEDTAASSREEVVYTLYLPQTAPVRAVDAVTLHGFVDERCEVEQRPERQPGGFVVEGYIRLSVRVVEG